MSLFLVLLLLLLLLLLDHMLCAWIEDCAWDYSDGGALNWYIYFHHAHRIWALCLGKAEVLRMRKSYNNNSSSSKNNHTCYRRERQTSGATAAT